MFTKKAEKCREVKNESYGWYKFYLMILCVKCLTNVCESATTLRFPNGCRHAPSFGSVRKHQMLHPAVSISHESMLTLNPRNNLQQKTI